MNFPDQRPAPDQRRFTSPALENTITETQAKLGKETELAWLFGNCFPNTLDTTVEFVDGERPDTFVITGDIPAMWLRDSSAQVWPYLPLIPQDARLGRMIAGVVNRQTDCVLLDPYANAFLQNSTDSSPHASDGTEMKPGVWERKWEIDSLCYVIRLAHGYWETTGDRSPFDGRWRKAMGLILQTFREQQRRNDRGPYVFIRQDTTPSESLSERGYGPPANPCGLIVSSFRPSDDACTLPYLVPSNMFAVQSLKQLAELAEVLCPDTTLGSDCRSLCAEIKEGLKSVALGSGPHGFDTGSCWCYECDGFGNRLFMDDANVPSLLSLPYLGFCEMDDPVYRATRRWVLSEANPYFRKGTAAEGVSSPHAGRDQVWPMAMILRALTSGDPDEQRQCVDMLVATHAGTGFMHETLHADDPARFTRPWFAWANTLFGELILTLVQKDVLPHG